jgi:hypothetical protein
MLFANLSLMLLTLSQAAMLISAVVETCRRHARKLISRGRFR